MQSLPVLIKHWAAAPGLHGRGVLRLVSSRVKEWRREGKRREEEEGQERERGRTEKEEKRK